MESNQEIDLLRLYAQQVINAHVSSYDRGVRILLGTTIDSIYVSVEVNGQAVDLMSGLSLIGDRWTMEGVRQSHPSFPEASAKLMFETIAT